MSLPFGSGSGFSFGQQPQTSQPQQTPSLFGGATQTNPSGFGFPQPNVAGVSFGAAPATQQPAFGFGGGTTNQQQQPTAQTAFGFSSQTNPPTTASTGLQFGAPQSSAPTLGTSNFGGGFGSPAMGIQSPFGGTPSANPSFGLAPGATSTPVTSFTTQTTKPAFGAFGGTSIFGSSNQQQPTGTTSGFGFGGQAATQQPQATIPGQSVFSSFTGSTPQMAPSQPSNQQFGFGGGSMTQAGGGSMTQAATAAPSSSLTLGFSNPATVTNQFPASTLAPAPQMGLSGSLFRTQGIAPVVSAPQAGLQTSAAPIFGGLQPAVTTSAAPAQPFGFGNLIPTSQTTLPAFGMTGNQQVPGQMAPQITTLGTGMSFGQPANTTVPLPTSAVAPFKPSMSIMPMQATAPSSSTGVVAPSTAMPVSTLVPGTGFQMTTVSTPRIGNLGAPQVPGVVGPTLTTFSVPAFMPLGGIKLGSTTVTATSTSSTGTIASSASMMSFDGSSTSVSSSVPFDGSSTTSIPSSVPTVTSAMISGFAFPSLAKSTAPTTTVPAAPISSVFSTPTSSVAGGTVTTLPVSIPLSSFGGLSAVSTTAPTSTLAPTTMVATGLPVSTIPSTTTVSSAVASGSVGVNFRQLEEMINKWTLDLEEQEKIYLNQATQVNAWDRLLIKNGEKITQLNDSLERVKLDQEHLEHEIDFIVAQQKELEDLLVPLEQKVEQMPAISVQQHADLEREHTYELAENIDAQMKRMAEDLKEVIDHLNASNNTSHETNDPFYKVSKILNAHMDSLQWIEQNTNLIQRKLEEVSQQYEVRRKDQERRFRLAYD